MNVAKVGFRRDLEKTKIRTGVGNKPGTKRTRSRRKIWEFKKWLICFSTMHKQVKQMMPSPSEKPQLLATFMVFRPLQCLPVPISFIIKYEQSTRFLMSPRALICEHSLCHHTPSVNGQILSPSSSFAPAPTLIPSG